MSRDWMEDPEARAWARRVSKDLVPLLRDSSMTLSIVPDEASLGDVKLAVEIGMSLLLGKPLILVVFPGRQVPEKLVAVADEIVEVTEDVNDKRSQARLQEAMSRVLGDDA